MRNAIAVMNTKGGVGKSTLVLALAETLSAHYGKNVLIIDSDAQTSISAMLLTPANLHRLQSDGLTIVDLLVASVLNNDAVDWPRFVVGGVSDVDEARSVYLVPSDMQLTLFEREVSKESLHGKLRSSIGALLKHVRGVFDIVLIDCPPGLSVLTESWLREADFHLSPTKPDYVSTNMKDAYSSVDADYQRWLMDNPDNLCFAQAVPRTSALQVAAQLSPVERSYVAKYPGESGVTIRAVAEELINRLTTANRAAQARPQPAPAKASPAQAPSLPKAAEPAPAAQKAALAPQKAAPAPAAAAPVRAAAPPTPARPAPAVPVAPAAAAVSTPRPVPVSPVEQARPAAPRVVRAVAPQAQAATPPPPPQNKPTLIK
jgi:chromosome partitioning protein